MELNGGEMSLGKELAASKETVPDHEYWMGQALELAKQAAAAGEVPVGALVVLDGEVIGRGWNRPISAHDPTAHAEVQALREAAARLGNYRMPGAVLYVTLEPCTMCAGALIHARISKLIYGASEPKAGAVASRAQVLEQPWMNWRIEVESGVRAQECAEVMSSFFRERRLNRKAGV